MKNLIFNMGIILGLIIPVRCISQQVIATAGGSASGTGIELSWTIGEPVTATSNGSDFYLTQGFHQSQPMTAMFDQEIILSTGWNIFSSQVITEDINLENMLQALIIAGKLKKVMDESGDLIEDWGISNGGWQNTIGDMKTTEGYKINVTSDALLEISGIRILLPLNILLNTGWNIISWPSPIEQNGMDVFQDLIGAGKLKKVMDESGNIIEDWGELNGGWKNSIGNLKPGEGYKVNVTEDCMLTINGSVTKSEIIIPGLIPSTHFMPAYKGNGTDHMNINLLNLNESGILEDDEIGIFDGNICVGSTKICNNNSSVINNQFSISIPVSAADGIESKNGYSDGNPIVMKLFRNGVEYQLTIEPINNSKTVFEKGSSLFAQLALPTGIEGIIRGGFTDVKVYPNPFSDEVNVVINLAEDAEVRVEVLNQLGQQVKFVTTKQLMPKGLCRLTWDGRNAGNQVVSPGIYYLKIGIDDSTIHRKIIYAN